MIVLFPGSLEVEATGDEEEEEAIGWPAFEDEADAVDCNCRTERRFPASPSNLTFAGGAAMFFGSNLERFPLGLPPELVEGRFLFSWEDMAELVEKLRNEAKVI